MIEMSKDVDSLEKQLGDWLENIKPRVVSILLEQPKLLFEVYKNSELHSRYVYFPSIYLDESEKDIGAILAMFWDIIRLVSRKGKKIRRKVIFETSKTISPGHMLTIYDSLVKYGTVEKIKKFLLKRVQYLRGIDRTEDELYVSLKYNDKPLPLSSMGDGFITLLRLSLLVGLSQKGVILWEEPEISLHPKFLEILGEEIVSYSNTVQFFISTHSLDLLVSILEKAEEQDKLSKINVIRLHYREDTKSVHAEVLNGKEAKEEIDEIGTDLRYT
ncbi:AAA family ATPase [Thermococcus sp.]